MHGYPILVPYDADRNNQPCELKGSKAHWAVIKGFMLPMINVDVLLPKCTDPVPPFLLSLFPERSRFDTLISCNQFKYFAFDPTTQTQSHIVPESHFYGTPEQILSLEMLEEFMYVIVRQSKSRMQGIWKWKDLCKSNAGLLLPSADRKKQNRWKIPDTLEALQNKFVLLSPIQKHQSQ